MRVYKSYLLIFLFHIATMSTLCGGPSQVKSSDEEVNTLVSDNISKVKDLINKCRANVKGSQMNENPEFEVHVESYRTQVVAGTNYFIKIKIKQEGEEYYVIRVFKPLPHTGEGPSFVDCKKIEKDDEPDYF